MIGLFLETLLVAGGITLAIQATLSLLVHGRASLWWPMRRRRQRMPRAVARVRRA